MSRLKKKFFCPYLGETPFVTVVTPDGKDKDSVVTRVRVLPLFIQFFNTNFRSRKFLRSFYSHLRYQPQSGLILVGWVDVTF